MGTFRPGDGDWRSTLQYSSSNLSFPIELFLQCMEHDASVQKLEDSELIKYTISFIDRSDLNERELSKHHHTWANLKSFLIKELGSEVTLQQKVNLLKSLTKGPTENCQHYLIRAKYVASLLKASFSHCTCPPASLTNEECTKILFLAGLEDYEKEFCNVNKVGNLEVLAELLNLNIRTEDVEEPTSHEVKVDPSDLIKQEETADEDKNYSHNNGDDPNDPDYHMNGVDDFDQDYDSEDEPLSKVKEEMDESDDKRREKRTKSKMGEARPCKHCHTIFNRWDDWKKHQKNCDHRLHGKPKPCKYCGIKFRLKEMKSHLRECNKFVKNETVKCQICQEDVTKIRFKLHCKKAHNGNTVSCSPCGEQVKTDVQLRRHMQHVHQDDRGKEIEQWAAEGKILVNRDAPKTEPLSLIEPVTLDEKTPDRRAQFKCAVCKNVIAGTTAFSEHIKREHDGKRFICDICPYASTKALCVYDHRLKIHNVLSGDWTLYQCQIGECTFKTVSHYAVSHHVRQTHLRIEEFKCQVCSKVFFSNGTLKSHTEGVHMGKKNYTR